MIVSGICVYFARRLTCADLESRFYQAISRLPEQQREILLQSANGKKIRDIALSLGISENTVKTQKKRAYFFLREQLGELWLFVLPLLFK